MAYNMQLWMGKRINASSEQWNASVGSFLVKISYFWSYQVLLARGLRRHDPKCPIRSEKSTLDLPRILRYHKNLLRSLCSGCPAALNAQFVWNNLISGVLSHCMDTCRLIKAVRGVHAHKAYTSKMGDAGNGLGDERDGGVEWSILGPFTPRKKTFSPVGKAAKNLSD